MMRFLKLSLPFCALCACAAPVTQSTSAAPAVAAPFVAPMDPGLIPCQSLSNPTALAVATDWAVGQARAAVLSGRIGGVPDSATISTGLAAYCAANRGETLRTATRQIGL